MSAKHNIPLSDRRKTVAQNAKIDVGVVAAHERLERELKRLGVEIKPRYNLDSPWRRTATRLSNRSRLPKRNPSQPRFP